MRTRVLFTMRGKIHAVGGLLFGPSFTACGRRIPQLAETTRRRDVPITCRDCLTLVTCVRGHVECDTPATCEEAVIASFRTGGE